MYDSIKTWPMRKYKIKGCCDGKTKEVTGTRKEGVHFVVNIQDLG